MKVLVTGVKGQLGYDVIRHLNLRGIECKGVDIEDFDLTDETAVREAITAYSPDSVVHCAAFTAVDKACLLYTSLSARKRLFGMRLPFWL